MATAKKAIVKKATVKKLSPRKVKKQSFESFKLNKEIMPFLTYCFTEQTVFWSIISIVILVLSLWVLSIQINITEILDNITNV